MNSAEIRAQNEYVNRMNRVIDYIDANLDGKLTLETVAGVAAFSPFHFHRIFKAYLGETLNGYILRKRLEKARCMLRYERRLSITEIALQCGFNSSSHFARTFKKHIGAAASRYRFLTQNSKIDQSNRNIVKDSAGPSLYDGHANRMNKDSTGRPDDLNVIVRTLPGFHVAYLREFGYGPQLKAAWMKLARRLEARDLLTEETTAIGVNHDDPDITPLGKCRYDACFTVPEGFRPIDGIGVSDLSGGKFACYGLETAVERIQKDIELGIKALFLHWLPFSGYQPDQRPCCELYRGNPLDRYSETVSLDICIPVKPL